MIRVVAIACLSTLLLLVLYLPSAHPPEHFVERVRHEHGRTVAFWGEDTAQRILDRTLALQTQTATLSPIPTPASAPALPSASLDSAVGQEMTRVNQRLFDSAYFRAIDALLLLASYRLSTLLEWLPRCAVLTMALVADALFVRARKSREFRHHDPEMFALFASAAIFALCATTLAMVWPWSLPPPAWALVPIGVAVLVSRAITHFHRRA